MRKIRPKIKQGVLTTNDVILEKHEMATINFLLALGYDIELIKPSMKRGVRTPDFFMSGVKWKMKSPEGGGKYTIQDTLRRAAKQSSNIIIDLSRIKVHQTRCLYEIKRQFELSKNIRRIKVITKQRRIILLNRIAIIRTIR